MEEEQADQSISGYGKERGRARSDCTIAQPELDGRAFVGLFPESDALRCFPCYEYRNFRLPCGPEPLMDLSLKRGRCCLWAFKRPGHLAGVVPSEAQ